MAIGKNKELGKKKKGGRKAIDPFSRKDWFEVKAPAVFAIRNVGYTMGTRSQGNKNVRDTLIGRVFECSLGDLKLNGEDDAFRKFKLRVEEMQGKKLLTNFYGMDMTTDKKRSLIKKWHTLIDAWADVKTTDGYMLRMFCIGFTKRTMGQIKKTSYAKTSQIKQIRRKMVERMQYEANSVSLAELVNKLIPEIIGREIERATQTIYPLNNVFIRKVKMIRAPKIDLNKLIELHGGGSMDKGSRVEREDRRDDDDDDENEEEEE
jgi:small subunit ribosomal protein S3Ae